MCMPKRAGTELTNSLQVFKAIMVMRCVMFPPCASAGPQDQGWGAAHFLRNETQAARAAVEALDKYSLKLASFQDKALEVIEEAHR